MLTLRLIRNCSSLLKLHPYLQANLEKRRAFPLKPFQSQALGIADQGRNFFVNSCTGSGKTFAYLVPIFNSILKQQEAAVNKSFHGAIILTLNRQLVSQIYREIKLLDPQKRLRVCRTGSLSQLAGRKINADGKSIDAVNSDIVSYIFWNKMDILISTPQALMNQMTIFKGQHKNPIDPEFVAIDEADLLLQIDKNVSRNTDGILKHIREHSTESSHIKYMLAASSFPKRYKGEESSVRLKQNFKVLEFVEGINRHKLSPSCQLFYVQISTTDEVKAENQKLDYLKRILTDRKDQRIIVFCKHRDNIQVVADFVQETLKIDCIPYYAELRIEERAEALARFDAGGVRILISSDLASRGLDFMLPVDAIVEFDMAENIVNFLNRAGRCARNDLSGQIITLVEPKNKAFFQHLRGLKEQNDSLDALFSRKRSYSKLYKQKAEAE